MPFVVPVKAMALTVSTLMCGTMFTTYYFCVHDSECPALPKLPTISNTWEETHSAATNQTILPPRLAADSVCCAAARPERRCIDAAYAALVRVASLRRILDSVARHRGRWTGGCVQPGHALLEQLASDGVAVHGVPSGRHATGCEG